MKRRIFSFLLAVVMVFSLAPSVFAAEGDTTLAVLTADKTSVRPGEDVTFTYTLQEQVDYIERMTIVLIYDANLFTWKSTDYEGSVFFTAPTINTADVSTGGEHRVRLVQASDDSDASVFPGKICSFTLTASEEITDTQLVYDIYNGTYGDFGKVSMEKFLRADVNASKNVDSADAVAIVSQFK